MDDNRKVFAAALHAGRILLSNGAELQRVEETMDRICRAFGSTEHSMFLLSNGILFTFGSETEMIARVEHVPIGGTSIDKIIKVNALSRELEKKEHTLDEALKILDEIDVKESSSLIPYALFDSLGCCAFCYCMGGSLKDSFISLAVGLLISIFMFFMSGRLSKFTFTLSSSMIIGGLCILLFEIGLGDSFGSMIKGALVCLTPGISLINGIRDIANGDYLSGSVRMLDVIVTFLCMAVGVAFSLSIYKYLFGGVL